MYKEIALLYTLENGDLVPNVREISVIQVKDSRWLNKLIQAQNSSNPNEKNITLQDKLYCRRLNRKIWLSNLVFMEYIKEQHKLPAYGHQGI